MVFALVTRALWGARGAWLRDVDWFRTTRSLAGFTGPPPVTKGAEERSMCRTAVAVYPEALEKVYQCLTMQPRRGSHVWCANSFADLSAPNGQSSGDIGM